MLDEDALLEKYKNFSKPAAKVLIKGNDLEKWGISFENLTLTTSISSEADSFTFSVNILDSLTGKLHTEWLKDLFRPESEIDIQIGYGKNLTSLLKGTITQFSFQGSESNGEITISGMDESFKCMKNIEEDNNFTGKSISDIVRTILKNYSLKNDIDASHSKPEEFKRWRNNKSDFQFIKELAEEINYNFYVKNKIVYFKKPAQSKEPVIGLKYGEILSNYSVDYNTAGVYSKVTVRGMDDKKQPFEASVELNSGTDAELDEFYANIKSRDEALKLAEALMKQTSENYITGNFECIGIPELEPGKYIRLDGIGEDLNGLYFVTSIKHNFNQQGYTQHVEFKSQVSNRSKRDPFVERESSNTKNRHKENNIIIGKVTNIKDPKNLGRIKVELPYGKEKAETDWAKVSTFLSGENFGSFFIPNVGDLVVVAFNDGNIDCPIVIGRLWNEEDKPPISIKSDGKNNTDVIKTKGGNQLSFENEDGKEMIVIKTKDGEGITMENGKKINISDSTGKNTLTIDTSKNSLEIKTDMKISMKSGGNKIIIDASSNGVTVESAASLKLKAQMVQIEAGTSMDIKSNGILNIKGAMTKIN